MPLKNNLFHNYAFFLLLYMVLLAMALIPYYINGTLILGGEGDYVLDFSTHLSKFSFTWQPTLGVGTPNIASGSTGLNIFSLWLIEKLTKNSVITNFVLIYSIYFWPFLAMYLVCKAIKATPFMAFVGSLFYVVNPFTLYLLNNLNQWNLFSATVMPLFLWVILRYYHSNFKLFFFSGFISTCFSFAYSNPPMLGIVLISIPLSTFIASYYHNRKVISTQILKKYSILLGSFLIFNSWWILPMFGVISAAQKMHTYSSAKSLLDTSVRGCGAIIAKMFSLTTIINEDLSYDFFAHWYGSIFAKLITLVPIFMIVYFVLISKNKRTRNLLNCAVFGGLLIVLFFVKGNAGPFGFIYNFMFRHLPFFYIFKSPVGKFGLLYVFVFSVLLLFVINAIKNGKYYKPILGIFTAYLLFCSAPIITGNIIPDYNLGDGKCASRKYKDKPEYKQFRDQVNNDSFQYRILSMPGVGNYQVLLPNYNNKYYTGLDPVLMNTNKPFLAEQSDIRLLYESAASTNYRKLLGIFNIGKIIINEDLIPWFGTIGIEDTSELKKIFSNFMSAETWGPITSYNNEDDFLPHIYTSQKLR